MWQLKSVQDKESAARLADILSEIADATSWFEDPKGWGVLAIFETKPVEEGLNELFAAAGLSVNYILEALEQRDWLAENRKHFPALTIGNFYIYGSHITDPLPADKICLLIDAATAFGTGQHGTTQGCLAALQRLASDKLSPKRVLDLGCGTAILAMAAARLFPNSTIIAADNDEEAVMRARLNSIDNALDAIEVCLSEGFSHEDLHHPHDLILANILAEPLIHLARDMYRYTAGGGFVILSGLLVSQQQAVVDAYLQQGFQLIEAQHIGEWATLLLRKP
ncbi:MAG: 50S ribosomal protein L11 methyltransferase [Holosporales bacterium]